MFIREQLANNGIDLSRLVHRVVLAIGRQDPHPKGVDRPRA